MVYCIIQSTSTSELVDKINYLIGNGCQVQGGISATSHYVAPNPMFWDFGRGGSDATYEQALLCTEDCNDLLQRHLGATHEATPEEL